MFQRVKLAEYEKLVGKEEPVPSVWLSLRTSKSA